MFGPGASVSSNNKIIFVPVNKQKINAEIHALDNIFPNFEKITINDPHKHDLAISVIISVIYFINLVFSKFLIDLSNTEDFKFEENTIHFFKRISGSSFKIQSLLSESILTDDLSLFQTLFMDNDTTLPLVQQYNLLFNKLLEGIEKKDKEFLKEFVQSTKFSIIKESDINNSYDILYKFLNLYYR
jgi:prephenate dehydrogenase